MARDGWPDARTSFICGMVVGPFYLAVGLAQAFLRDGFDLGRHSLSALANGPGGWVQTANFVLSGLMVIIAAVGIRRALRPRARASGWFLGWFGVSMLVAAVFPADPVDGFPPGTPEGFPTTMSTPGIIHFAAGASGFLALAVSCVVVAVAMSRRGETWMARLSLVAGFSIVAGFMAPAFLPAAGPVAGIWFAVVVGWAWLAATSARLYREASAGGTEDPSVSALA
ncbi:MAG: DUF998 domain-containing protein [Gemmatimonadota bacterium]